MGQSSEHLQALPTIKSTKPPQWPIGNLRTPAQVSFASALCFCAKHFSQSCLCNGLLLFALIAVLLVGCFALPCCDACCLALLGALRSLCSLRLRLRFAFFLRFLVLTIFVSRCFAQSVARKAKLLHLKQKQSAATFALQRR